jgi:hypothetical protein
MEYSQRKVLILVPIGIIFSKKVAFSAGSSTQNGFLTENHVILQLQSYGGQEIKKNYLVKRDKDL